MITEIINAKDGIEKGAKLLNEGELVVFPTETVYGLGANAFDSKAVEKIFIAKGRPQDNPLIVHISSLEQVKDIAVDIPKEFYILAERFMPGPLTVILKKKDTIPYIVTAGGETVGIRMPKNEFTRELISKSKPLAAPSANKSKHVSPTTAQHVYDDLKGEIQLILDDGPCEVGIESTVLDLTTDVPTILRPGAITKEMLLDIFGAVSQNGEVIKIAKAPGMKYTHYAPKIKTEMANSIDSAIKAYDESVFLGENPVLLFMNDSCNKVGKRNVINLGSTLEEYCKNIYSALREAEIKYNLIIVEKLDDNGLAYSIMNRVNKAAGGKEV